MHPFGGRLDEEVANEVTAVLAWSEKACGWKCNLFPDPPLPVHPEVNLSIPLPLGGTAGRYPILDASHEGGADIFAQSVLCPVRHNRVTYYAHVQFFFQETLLLVSITLGLGFLLPLPAPSQVLLFSIRWSLLAPGWPWEGGPRPWPLLCQPTASCFLWTPWQGFLDN